MNWSLILISFGVTAILDGVWAWYIQAIAKEHTMTAGFTSAILIGMHGAAVLIYKDKPEMLVPQMIGGFVGTIIAMEYKKRKTRKEMVR